MCLINLNKVVVKSLKILDLIFLLIVPISEIIK